MLRKERGPSSQRVVRFLSALALLRQVRCVVCPESGGWDSIPHSRAGVDPYHGRGRLLLPVARLSPLLWQCSTWLAVLIGLRRILLSPRDKFDAKLAAGGMSASLAVISSLMTLHRSVLWPDTDEICLSRTHLPLFHFKEFCFPTPISKQVSRKT